MIKFDFIIISYNTKLLTIQCINSLYNTIKKLNTSNSQLNNEFKIQLGVVIVVDNGSIDGTIEEIKLNYKEVKLIENNQNFGYAKACNIGIRNSNSEYFIISNSDILVYPSSILGIVDTLINHKASLAGIQQLFPNYKWQRSWGYAPGIKLSFYNLFLIELILNKFRSYQFNKTISKLNIKNILDLEIENPISKKSIKEVPYLDGAFLGFNRNLLGENCYLDEDFFFYTEELELCYKVGQNGGKVLFNPNYFVIHYRGGSDVSNTSKIEKSKFNPNSYKLLYETKLLFSKKHLSSLVTKLYFATEIFLFSQLYILSYLLGFTKLGSKKEFYKYLIKINFDILKKI